MKIFLGTDHNGFELKNAIKSYLSEKGLEIVDCGALEFNNNDDYPDFVSKAAIGVSQNPESKGIIMGKSGAGECIAANKVNGIRAIVGFNKKNIELSRIDNDANVLSLGSAFVDEKLAKEFVKIFLETRFTQEERHIRRINKIKNMECCGSQTKHGQ